MAKRYAKSNSLKYQLVQYLVTKVIETFEKEYQEEHQTAYDYANDSALYGFGNHAKPDMDSIRTYVCNNKDVQNVVKKYAEDKGIKEVRPEKHIEGNYLWKKHYQARQKPSEPIPFSDFYQSVYLAYIKSDLRTLEQEYENSHSYYVGYYMSFADFNIKTLLFRISHTHENSDGKNLHDLTIEGIHHKEGALKIDNYNGKIWNEEGWLYGYAKGQKYEHKRLSIMGGSVDGQAPIVSNPIIRLMLQGITFDNDRIFVWEVLLYRTTYIKVQENRFPGIQKLGPVDPKIIGEIELKYVSLYLAAHRNVASFSSDAINDLVKINVKKTPVKNFFNIIGSYNLWNFDFDFKNIVQSSLIILGDKIGTLKTSIPPKNWSVETLTSKDNSAWRPDSESFFKEHNALINISRANEQDQSIKVVIVTFDGIDIVNTAMFDFPTSEQIDPNKIFTGAFSSLGDPVHKNVSGYFAMKKHDASDVEVKIIPLESAFEFAKKTDNLTLLNTLLAKNVRYYTKLDSETKSNINGIIDQIDRTLSSVQKNKPVEDIAPGGWE